MKKFIKNNYQRIILCALLIAATALLLFAEGKLYRQYVDSTVASVIFEPTVVENVSALISDSQSLVVTSPSTNEVTVDTPIINFSGVSKPDLPLKINDTDVIVGSDGSFSFDVKLNPGANTVTVSNGDMTLTFTVNYNMTVIQSVSPDKNMSADGGTVLDISATALSGATVSAKINGSVISLVASQESGQFITYYGTYTIPQATSKKVNLGRIVFTANYNGFSQTVNAGSVSVNAKALTNVVIEQGQGSMVAPVISGDNVVSVLSPNEDHGRGQNAMCVVTADYAETVPSSTADDKSDPNYSPEVKGTIDYVVSEATYGDSSYYILLSGTKVNKEDVSVFDGYIMPTNTISAYKSYTSSGYTNAILTMNWKVPFNATFKEQNYYRGTDGKPFYVSSFTSSYIDFVFSYTNAAEGSFDFSQSGVVSSAKWINIGNDGTATLRVYLRNAGSFYGYRAYFSDDNRLVLSFREKPQVSGATVMLDPGHGGKDCGAIGTNGIYRVFC